MKSIATLLFAGILIAGSANATEPGFNSVPLRVVASSPALRAQPVEGQIYILSGGLREMAASGDHRAQLAKTGWTFLASLGPDAALVQATGEFAMIYPNLVPVEKEWRIAEDVAPLRSSRSTEKATLMIHYAGGDSAASEAILKALPAGAELTGSAPKGVLSRAGVRVPEVQTGEFLDLLLEDPRVVAVQRASGAKLYNSTARRIVQSGTITTGGETIWGHGIRGEDQIIAVLDSGADPLNCYLAESNASFPPVVGRGVVGTPDLTRRKIIIYDMIFAGDDPADGRIAYDNHGHGTYVGGNAAASAANSPFSTAGNVYNGVAPAAKLVVQDGGYVSGDNCSDLAGLGCPVLDLTDVLDQAWDQGARIHNNSWGDRENFSPQNTYTAICEDFDDIAWRHPEFLGVFAAGNSGGGGFNIGSVGSPSTAKNVLSVAGTENTDFEQIVSFSSIGWASDGRIKPDVAAPAQTFSSQVNFSESSIHCTVGPVQGTSMASPVTAGSAALVRQYFEEGWYPSGALRMSDGFEPTAALLKATIIAGAQPVASEPPPPSQRQGWGRVNLDESLFFQGEDQGLAIIDGGTEFSNDGEFFETTYNLTGGDMEPIVFVLTWTDAPGSTLSTTALVNDLDLEVSFTADTGRGGVDTYLGNNFDEFGVSDQGGTADVLNNVEVVKLAARSNGTYTVRVSASNILEGAQDFALVVNAPAQFITASEESWVIY